MGGLTLVEGMVAFALGSLVLALAVTFLSTVNRREVKIDRKAAADLEVAQLRERLTWELARLALPFHQKAVTS